VKMREEMARKILTSNQEIVFLSFNLFLSRFLRGGNLLLKRQILVLVMLLGAVAVVYATPADDAYKQAQDLQNKGDVQGAINAVLAGIITQPDNLKLNTLAGDLYMSQGQYDNALKYYNAALQKKAKDPDALYGAGMADLKLKKYDEALSNFDAGDKTKAKFLYGLGLAQMEKGDYNNADLNFRKAIDKDKKNPEYHIALADVSYRNKTYAIAISEYANALAMDSTLAAKYPDMHYKLAQSYLNLRNVPKAIDEYKLDLQINSADTAGWMELARIYDVSNNTPEAIYCYEKYASIVPGNGNAWFDLGELYLKLPDQEKAAAAFEKSVSLNAKTAESFGYLAKIYSDRKEYDKAFNAYSRFEAALGAPDSAQYWLDKGKVLMKLGEKNPIYFDTALTALNKVISLDSTATPAYEYAGLTSYYLKNYPQAISYFTKEISIDSTSINAYRNMAFSYLKTEQYAPAARAFEKALDIKPDDVPMRAMLGKIYTFDKNYAKSVEAYEYILSKGGDQVTDSLRCEIYPELGLAYLSLNNCRAATPILLKAEQCRPREISILKNIATSYILCNQVKEAHSYFVKVLEIDPKDKEAIKGKMQTEPQSGK
jgi:tetratricopeptide (TPR) repeat protein